MVRPPLESKFRITVDAFLKALPKSFWESIQQRAIRGSADKTGCVNGIYCRLELKRSANAKRGELQNYLIGKARLAGGYAEFVYPENWETIKGDLLQLATGSREMC
jgi:hypothetical protein